MSQMVSFQELLLLILRAQELMVMMQLLAYKLPERQENIFSLIKSHILLNL